MTPNLLTGNHPTLLYRFLTSLRFRIGRHMVLIAVLTIISFNQTFLSYQDSLHELGGWTYLIVVFVLFTYAAVVYFNLRYLLPRYLLGKRYLTYVVLLSMAMSTALIAQIVQEYVVYSLLGIVRTQGILLSVGLVMDYISSFLLDMLCMIGGTMTVLLKLWMVDNQRVMQLEKVHTQSEVAKLKEQVSPSLLFKILNRSGQLALTEGDKASKMLMKLSQLLRYQLYDCSRERVLLSAEINFLSHYLSLEQLYAPQLNYTLTSDGEVSGRLVPPLLFIPFVQYAVKQHTVKQLENIGEGFLSVRLEAVSDDIVFTCLCPGVNLGTENVNQSTHYNNQNTHSNLTRIRQRLDLQYRNRYSLLMSGE